MDLLAAPDRVPPPPLVGRAEERALLGNALAGAAAGQSRVVLIGGEAGVGKSALVEQLAATSREQDVRVLFGACLVSAPEVLPLAPFIGALRRLVRELGPEQAAAVFREDTGFEWLLPERPGTPQGEAAEHAPAFPGLLVLLDRLSEQRPVLLVLEDVHWADPSTRKLLGVLARALDTARVLVVATYRTDDLVRGHPLRPDLAEWQRVRGVLHLELGRLSRGETAELIANSSGEPPAPALVERIFDRSGGNAFFVEQLVRAERAGAAGRVPDSLRDLLLSRVERLPQAAQQLVQLLAVGGPWVRHRLLTEVAALPEDELLDALRAAVDAHVLVTGEDGYDFQHALVREVVGAALLPGERIRMHHAYATALEKYPELTAAERHAARTAHHWLGAQDPDRALPALVEAAAVAARFKAYTERHQLLTRALEVWPIATSQPVSRLELLVAAAYTAWRAVDNESALALIDEALPEAEAVADTDRVAALLALRSRTLLRRGGTGALRAAREAERLALPRDCPTRAKVLEVLCAALTSEGHTGEARDVGKEAVRLAVGLGDDELQVAARTATAQSLSYIGEHEPAVAELRRARTIAEDRRDAQGLTRVCVNLSMELWAYGRHEEAMTTARAGIHAARRAGLARAQGMYAATNLASSLFARGRWDEAEAVLTEALEERPSDVYLAYPQMVLAELAIGRGELAAAREHYSIAAETLSIRQGRLEASLPMARLAAELALGEDRVDDALRTVLSVVDAADVRGQPVAHSWPLLATAARVQVRARADDLPVDGTERLRNVAAKLPTHVPAWRAWALQVAAELESGPSTTAWPGVVAAWETAGEPYPTCRARLRAAEAAIHGHGHDQARRWLRAAGADAERLGAAAVSREIEAIEAGTRSSPGDSHWAGLTRREIEVLLLLAEGASNKAIAEKLVITEKTVSVHVSRILGKLGAGNRTHAVVTASRLGLVPP